MIWNWYRETLDLCDMSVVWMNTHLRCFTHLHSLQQSQSQVVKMAVSHSHRLSVTVTSCEDGCQSQAVAVSHRLWRWMSVTGCEDGKSSASLFLIISLAFVYRCTHVCLHARTYLYLLHAFKCLIACIFYVLSWFFTCFLSTREGS